jgi:hypothetical protein
MSINKIVEFLELGHPVDTILSYFVINSQVVDRTVHRYISEARKIYAEKQLAFNKELDAVTIEAKKKEREIGLYDVIDIKLKLQEVIDNVEDETRDRLKAIDQYTKIIGGYSSEKLDVKMDVVRFDFDILPEK